MKRIVMLLLVAMLFLCFFGCKVNSDINETESSQTENQNPAEMETAMIINTGMIINEYTFEEDGIYASENKVGIFSDGRAMLSLTEFASHFGWEISVSKDKWELSKDGYSVSGRLGSIECETAFRGKAFGKFNLSYTAVFGDGDVWLYSVDMENVFGLDALWIPESKTLYFKQEEYEINDFSPKDIIEIEGEKAIARMEYVQQANAGKIFIASLLPNIFLTQEGKSFNMFSSATLRDIEETEEIEYELMATSREIPIYEDAELKIDVRKKGRIIYVCEALLANDHPENEPIEIRQNGPWEPVALHEPEFLLTKAEDGQITLSGSCSWEGLRLKIFVLCEDGEYAFIEEGEIKISDEVFKERIALDKGFYRLELLLPQNGNYQELAHFYCDFN